MAQIIKETENGLLRYLPRQALRHLKFWEIRQWEICKGTSVTKCGNEKRVWSALQTMNV
ncbi:hypothetical protein KIN20_023242 [Parelaphostrongylus tenuis]|uniref:Uncharacterized protein n=1 Tax=Parelaphostrongylus tenuis TaxID=148309 RepID=A0AAD5QSU1_PARTN|nr:hypothetical protein KIN20_023242 [Parelaphostrongylus tenuis]